MDAHGAVVGSLVSMTHVSVGTDAGQLRSCWTMVTGQINSLMPDTILQQILTKKPGVEDEKDWFPWHDGGRCQVLIVMRSHDLTQPASVLTHNIIPIVSGVSLYDPGLSPSFSHPLLLVKPGPPS